MLTAHMDADRPAAALACLASACNHCCEALHMTRTPCSEHTSASPAPATSPGGHQHLVHPALFGMRFCLQMFLFGRARAQGGGASHTRGLAACRRQWTVSVLGGCTDSSMSQTKPPQCGGLGRLHFDVHQRCMTLHVGGVWAGRVACVRCSKRFRYSCVGPSHEYGRGYHHSFLSGSGRRAACMRAARV